MTADALFTGSSFTLTSTLNGAIGTTPTGAYVWGFDRGAGTPRFAPTYAGVLFDSVVIVNPDGTGSVRDLTNGAATPLPAGSVSITGSSFSATFSASLLPGKGNTADKYTWNLWPRVGNVAGLPGVSDFAPDNSNAPVGSVPEPSALAFLGAGVFSLMSVRRRLRRGR